MEKERRIKTISVIALIVAVLGLTVAFAVLSTNLVINGTATVDPGKWEIYFEQLSSANTKGKASVEGTASINETERTKIEGINVTLNQPKDEVTYTVKLVNDGDIDAEISSIKEPVLNETEKQYIEFSAIYDDNKPITVGDILKGGKTENVTISIKFKKEVTELPNADLTVNLSYEINYVQTDKKVDDNVHKGEAIVPQIDYDSLSEGGEVTLGTEEFYVMKNDTKTLTLLAKYNLLVGNRATIKSFDTDDNLDPSNLTITPIQESEPKYGKQSSDTKGVRREDSAALVGTIEFAKPDETFLKKENKDCEHGYNCHYGYWIEKDSHSLKSEYGNKYPANVYDNNSSLYKYIEDYRRYLKEDLGYNVENARLMTYDEAISLGCISEGETGSCSSASPWVYETIYWLGSAADDCSIWTIFNGGEFLISSFDADYGIGLRPVIEINKE